MRKPILDALPPLPEESREEGEPTHETYHFELITPMVGGDSESWKLDEKAPVRAQSIKGQLRFWWRTMQSETVPEKLLEKENALWGGTRGDGSRTQSPVKIAVSNQRDIRVTDAELNEKGWALEGDTIPNYIGFPLAAARKTGPGVNIVERLKFDLQVSCPSACRKEVIDTLTLWTLFGGVGARTRRGCGSVYCEGLMNSFQHVEDIRTFFDQWSEKKTELSYPRLSGASLAFKKGNGDTPSSWRQFVEDYARFRQDRKIKKPRPGRSYWPEPDAIRRVVDKASSHHEPVHPDGIWFPRAAYGLPIITQFNRQANGAGDPEKSLELKPANFSRWPSPVILKVIKLAGGNILKAAIVLNQKFPEELALYWDKKLYPLKGSGRTREIAFEGKTLRTGGKGPIKDGESLYQVLFRGLGLEEVK